LKDIEKEEVKASLQSIGKNNESKSILAINTLAFCNYNSKVKSKANVAGLHSFNLP
jgi:hypothetical protein